MITYNDIYEVLRKEKYSEQLQKLPQNFIREVSDYFKDKKKINEKEADIFSEVLVKSKKQYENAVSIFGEIILRRKKKLLNLAFIAKETGISKRDFENMLDFEKEMFDRIIKSMEDSDKAVSSLMNGKKENNHILVTFKEDTEEFLDSKGEGIGPFSRGEMANLPEDIIKILKDANKVEVVEEE